MQRYLAFFWATEDADSAQTMQVLEHTALSSVSEWSVAYKSHGALVVHTGLRQGTTEAYPLRNNAGVVLGALFSRSGSDSHSLKIPTFDQSETAKIIATGGKHLVDYYWGKYIAIIKSSSPSGHDVLLDPTAQMPCFHIRWKGLNVFCSHIDDCVNTVPVKFTLNARHLTAHLLSSFKLTRETALREVEIVPGGERQTIAHGAVTRTVLWHPEYFWRDPLENEVEAADALRETLQTTINALASRHQVALHRLSGGFDSSVVAGCLALAPTKPEVVCFNAYISPNDKDMPLSFPNLSKRYRDKIMRVASHGDERQFARLVADHWGFKLFEHERSVATVKLDQTWNAPLAPLPSRYVQYVDQDSAELRLVREHKATAVFNGLAGDELFFTSLQSLGILDYAYSHGFGDRFFTELTNSCKLSRESVGLVLYEAIKHGMLRRPRPRLFDYLDTPHLMRDEMVAALTQQDVQHPWEAGLRQLPPGKLLHIYGLASSGFYTHNIFHREPYAETIIALNAQPLAELCMRIPVYVLLAGGVSRGLARKAFANLLPAKIRRRTVKGYTSSLTDQLIRENLPMIREALLDGELVRQGILDRAKLDAYLIPGQAFESVSGTQILLYFGAEAWLRQWTTIMRADQLNSWPSSHHHARGNLRGRG